jgi:hypothetical protein
MHIIIISVKTVCLTKQMWQVYESHESRSEIPDITGPSTVNFTKT